MSKRTLSLAAVMLAILCGGVVAGYSLANSQRSPGDRNAPTDANNGAATNCVPHDCTIDFEAFCAANLKTEPPFDCEAQLKKFMDECCPASRPTSPGGLVDPDADLVPIAVPANGRSSEESQ